MLDTSKWPSEPNFCTRYACSLQKKLLEMVQKGSFLKSTTIFYGTDVIWRLVKFCGLPRKPELYEVFLTILIVLDCTMSSSLLIWKFQKILGKYQVYKNSDATSKCFWPHFGPRGPCTISKCNFRIINSKVLCNHLSRRAANQRRTWLPFPAIFR